MRASKLPITMLAATALSLASIAFVRSQTARKGELSARQIARTTFPSVVVLIAEDRVGSYLGSGFFIDSDVVATNYHVIKGATKIIARRVGQERVYHVSVVTFDDERDLALLRVEGAAARPLTLGRGTGDAAVGDVVYVAGNPEGLEGTFSQGIISALRGREYFQITAPISKGSSGGPVLNRRGEVIGVAVGTIEEGQNLNFAIPISWLRPLVARVTVLRRVPGSTRREPMVTGRSDPEARFVDDGLRLLSENRYVEAETAFKNALRLKAEDAGALLGLGKAYEGQKRYQDAISVYEDMIRSQPREEDGYQSLAMLLMSQDRYSDAVDIYKRAIKVIPKSVGPYVGAASMLELQWMSESMNQGLLVEAESILKTAVQNSDDPSWAYRHLGDLYCNHWKRCSDAITAYQLALDKVDRTNPITAPVEVGSLHYKLGHTYLALGDRASAIKEYRLLKSLGSSDAESLFNEIYR